MLDRSNEWMQLDTRSSVPLTRNAAMEPGYHWDQETMWFISMEDHGPFSAIPDFVSNCRWINRDLPGSADQQARWNPPPQGLASQGLAMPCSSAEISRPHLTLKTTLPTLTTSGLPHPSTSVDLHGSWLDSPSQNRDPWIGRLLGPFRLERLIGQGGSSRVYEARHIGIVPRSFAIKLFTKWSDANYARFENEVRALEQLDHPGLVSVISAGQTYEGIPFLVMNLVNGQRLDDWVRTHQSCPRTIAQIIIKVAQAMAVVHRLKLLHRDLKPSNIVMSSQGWPVVTDFGLAKQLANENSGPLTDSGQTMGSLGFLAPELSQTEKPSLLPTIDVYGLGATLYYLLTEKTPACSTDWWNCLEDLRTRDAIPVRRLNPDIPEDLESICMRCLEKNPNNRYEDMESLAADLQRWLDHEPVIARPIGPVSRLARWCRREPKLASLTLAICLLLLASTGIFAFLWQQSAANYRLAEKASKLISEELVGNFDTEFLDQLQVEGNHQLCIRLLEGQKHTFESIVADWPQNEDFQRRLAETKYRLGTNACCQSQGMNSMDELGGAYRIFSDLARRSPQKAQYRFDQFHCLLAMAIRCEANCERRLWYLDNGYLLINSLVDEFSLQPDYRDALALQCNLLAQFYNDYSWMGFQWKSMAWLDRGLRTAQDNVRLFPSKPLFRKHIVGAYRTAAEFCRSRKNFPQARIYTERALAEAQELCRLVPEISDLFLDVAMIHQELADIAMDCWDFDESENQFHHFTEMMAAGSQAFPGQGLFRTRLEECTEKYKMTRAQKLQEYFNQQ